MSRFLLASAFLITVTAGCALTGPHSQGERLLRQGDYQAAVDAYTRAIEQEDHVVVAYANRCYAYGALDQHERAVEDCTRALDLMGEPADDEARSQRAEILNNRGVSRISIGENEDAINDFAEAMELRENYAEAYANRGRTYVEMENYDAALRDLDKCVEMDPAIANCYGNRAAVYTALGEPQQALDEYATAIEIDHSAEAYFDRASLLYTLGCFPDAQKDYAEAMERTEDGFMHWIASQQAEFLANWEGEFASLPPICPSSEAEEVENGAGGEPANDQDASAGDGPTAEQESGSGG